MSDAQFPVFDVNGKYLYFTASTDAGLAIANGDLSSLAHPVTRSAYVVVLDKTLPSPLPPESDDEKAAEEKAKADAKDATKNEDTKEAKKDKKDKESKDKEAKDDKDKDKDKKDDTTNDNFLFHINLK
jgi:tricorn protease